MIKFPEGWAIRKTFKIVMVIEMDGIQPIQKPYWGWKDSNKEPIIEK